MMFGIMIVLGRRVIKRRSVVVLMMLGLVILIGMFVMMLRLRGIVREMIAMRLSVGFVVMILEWFV